MEYVYRFPVVRGIQAESEYYIAMVPLKMLAKLFPVEDEEFVLPEYRAQRKLNEARIPVIDIFLKIEIRMYFLRWLLQSMENIDLKQTRIMMKQEFLKYRWMPIS